MEKTTKKEVEEFIVLLLDEADACADIGSNFSASQMRDEAERLQLLLKSGIVPQVTIR